MVRWRVLVHSGPGLAAFPSGLGPTRILRCLFRTTLNDSIEKKKVETCPNRIAINAIPESHSSPQLKSNGRNNNSCHVEVGKSKLTTVCLASINRPISTSSF
jgi:hypothetical protein